MIGFEQLQTFLEVARAGSFANAARRLSLPRSTVTARVRALEDHLNVRLLHRTTRRVALTDEGRRYFDSCARAFEELLQAEHDITGTTSPTGTIRMSVPIDMPKDWVAEQVIDFQSLYPNIVFEIDISDKPIDFIKDNFDLALRGHHPGNDSNVARKISSSKLVLVTAGGTSQTPNQTIKGRSLIDPVGLAPQKLLRLSTRSPFQVHNFEMAKQLVLRSDAMGLLPIPSCDEELSNGRLVTLEPPCRLPALDVFIVMPTRSFVPRRIRLFVDHLAAVSSQ